MIFDTIGIFMRRATSRKMQRGAIDRAERWAQAAAVNPDLTKDLIIMGRLLSLGVLDAEDRLRSSALELAYEQGRRDLALDLLAMMHTTPYQLNQLMKETRYDTRKPDE